MANVIEDGMSSAKDFSITSLDLINSAGQTISLISAMIELTIHQSIDAMVMFGELLVVDGNDIFNVFSLNGSEYLKVNIDQPSMEQPIEKTFRIYKVGERSHNNNAGAKYIIYFASNEMMLSNSIVVSKAYKNKKTSDIVYDVLKNILKVNSKRITKMDSTAGLFDFVVPSYRPFEAIEWAVTRSYNSAPNYCYYFFEDRDGFKFTSLQSMYKQKVIKNLKYEIKSVNEAARQSSDVGKNRNSIEKFTIINDFDTMASSARGAFASKLLAVDVFSQQFKYYNYSVNDAESQGRLLNKYKPINDESLSKTFYSNYRTYIEIKDTASEKENSIDKWLMPRQLHLNLIENFKIRAVMAGDITMRAGQIVSFDFPKFISGDETGKELDKFRTGKYLLSSVSHTFKNTGVFESIVEMVSDSYSQQVPSSKVK